MTTRLREATELRGELIDVLFGMIDAFQDEAPIDLKGASESMRAKFLSDDFLVLREKSQTALHELGLEGPKSKELMWCWLSRQDGAIDTAKQIMNDASVMAQSAGSGMARTMEAARRVETTSSCNELVAGAESEEPRFDWTPYVVGAVLVAALVGGYYYATKD